MRQLKIWESVNQPLDRNILWLNKGQLLRYGNKGWEEAIANDINIPWGEIKNKPNFASVATTGSYNDLKDKPKANAVAKLQASASNTEVINKLNAIIDALKGAGLMA